MHAPPFRGNPNAKTHMDHAEYHRDPAIGSSMLKEVLRSPAHFWSRYRDPQRQPQPPSDAMQFGTCVHAAILEPDKLSSVMIELPDDAPDKRSKAGKDWWADFARTAAGRIILKPEAATRVGIIAAEVRADSTCAALLDDCDLELPGFWTEKVDGAEVRCKFKPDAIKRDRGMIIDVKTTDDASPEAFSKSIANYRYDLSAAHYLEGSLMAFDRLPHSFIFIAVETVPPFALACYRADQALVATGQHDRERALRRIVQCERDGDWPGYPAGIWPIGLPKWARVIKED